MLTGRGHEARKKARAIWVSEGAGSMALHEQTSQSKSTPTREETSQLISYSVSGNLSAGSVLKAGGVKMELKIKCVFRGLIDL